MRKPNSPLAVIELPTIRNLSQVKLGAQIPVVNLPNIVEYDNATAMIIADDEENPSTGTENPIVHAKNIRTNHFSTLFMSCSQTSLALSIVENCTPAKKAPR